MAERPPASVNTFTAQTPPTPTQRESPVTAQIHAPQGASPHLEVVQGRITSPAGHTTPPHAYKSWNEYMHDIEQLEAQRWDDEADRGLKAMRLAPSIAVYRALIAGDAVPRSWLDQKWARRYGLR